ncbi:unnamed protein product [Boreogadus saida]
MLNMLNTSNTPELSKHTVNPEDAGGQRGPTDTDKNSLNTCPSLRFFIKCTSRETHTVTANPAIRLRRTSLPKPPPRQDRRDGTTRRVMNEPRCPTMGALEKLQAAVEDQGVIALRFDRNEWSAGPRRSPSGNSHCACTLIVHSEEQSGGADRAAQRLLSKSVSHLDPGRAESGPLPPECLCPRPSPATLKSRQDAGGSAVSKIAVPKDRRPVELGRAATRCHVTPST